MTFSFSTLKEAVMSCAAKWAASKSARRGALTAVTFTCAAYAAAAAANEAERTLTEILGFEAEPTAGKPAGWRGGPQETLYHDKDVVHGGRGAARIERDPTSAGPFSTLTYSVPMDFTGSQIELRGFIRTEAVSESVALWLREDGDEGQVEFTNRMKTPIKGTTDWQEYTIQLPWNPAGKTLVFGMFLAGTGKAWVDDLQLRVDGKPIWDAPKYERAQTILDRDREFDPGSKISLTSVTPTQIENLSTLARVWGFLKYYHPKIAAGDFHWDYELFRVLPAVLDAKDRMAATVALVKWLDRLDETSIAPGNADSARSQASEHSPKGERQLKPELRWMEDEAVLGAELSSRLKAIEQRPRSPAAHFYVSQVKGVGNPVFAHELAYPTFKYPDAGFQLLGLFRYWNVIQYWFPYRDLIDENWDAVLADSIPRIALAASPEAYQLELLRLIARVHDGHANLWGSLHLRPPVGQAQLPLEFRFIEGRAVVMQVDGADESSLGAIMRGDVLCSLDGVPIAELVAQWTPFYAASNHPTRLRDIARSLGRGPVGTAKLQLERDGRKFDVELPRTPDSSRTPRLTHDLPGPAFRLLSNEVAYLKLSSVKAADAATYVEQAAGTQGWIIDLRNYPSEFMVFALGMHFVSQPTEFVRFTIGQLDQPGAFTWTPPIQLSPKRPYYHGKLVILVDEMSQSQAEYTTMAFRAALGAIVVGSTTAGADGNVSAFSLPGGFRTMISGIGVFYPDKRPTQCVGIVPDLEVRPTIEGIKQGRDEVLEAAWKVILGRAPTSEERQNFSTAERMLEVEALTIPAK